MIIHENFDVVLLYGNIFVAILYISTITALYQAPF